MARASQPDPLSIEAVSSAAAILISVTMTFAPSFPKDSAVALPIPEPAPVTKHYTTERKKR